MYTKLRETCFVSRLSSVSIVHEFDPNLRQSHIERAFSSHFDAHLILVSSFFGVQIANAVNQGKLVPEDIMFELLSKRLEDGYCKGETGFILDGIPRTQIQAVKSNVLYHMILSCLLY